MICNEEEFLLTLMFNIEQPTVAEKHVIYILIVLLFFQQVHLVNTQIQFTKFFQTLWTNLFFWLAKAYTIQAKNIHIIFF